MFDALDALDALASLDSGSLQRGELTLHVSQGASSLICLKTEEFQVSTAL